MDRSPRVTIIVPALNEAESIAAVVRRVPYPPSAVIVADNGSTDGTADLALASGARVVRAPQRGYGRACLAALAVDPDSDVFVFLDADLSESPEDVPALVAPITKDQADFVLGDRGGFGRPWHARIGTSLCVWLINLMWGTRYKDLGPFRAIRGSSLRALRMQDETWGWTIEMQVRAAEHQLRTMEMPVASGPRSSGQSKISGSLVGTVRAAGRMLHIIARLRLTRRRRRCVLSRPR